MDVFCPQCAGATVVDPSAVSAQCRACGADLPVNLPVFGPPSMQSRPQAFGLEDMAAVQPVVPTTPVWPWMEQQTPEGAWTVYAPRQKAGGWAALSFVVLVTACLTLAGSTSKLPVGSGLLLLAAAWPAYRALSAAVNRRMLRIDTSGVAFLQVPVPQPGGFRLPLVTVTAFQPVRGPKVQVNGIRTVAWAVHVVFDAGAKALPLPWMDRDRADFVARRLTEMLTEVRRRAGLQPLSSPGMRASPSAPL